MNDGSVRVQLASIQCFLVSICVLCACGCGTTKWSDTHRTGTEQLLISNAIDRVVNKVDFSPMHGKKCFLDTSAIAQTTDRDYLATTIRQHLAAKGAILAADKEDAEYVVEIRAGAVGTDRDDLLVGIPAMTLPSIPSSDFTGAAIPEIPFIKRTKQRGVANIALFAYNKTTGKPVWISGNRQGESTARNLWFAGAGPLTRGTIYSETTFAGNPLPFWSHHNLEMLVDKSQVFSEAVQSEPTIQVPTLGVPLPVNPFSPISEKNF